MPDYFVPLDANYPDNDKFYGLDPLAELLIIRLFAAAKRARNEGEFPRAGQVAAYAHDVWERYGVQPDELVTMLVEHNLLTEHVAGHRITGWKKHNGFREPGDGMAFDPENPADAAAWGNHLRWHVRKGKTKPTCRFCVAPEEDDLSDSSADDRPDVAPIVAPTSHPNRHSKAMRPDATAPALPDAAEVVAAMQAVEVAPPEFVRSTLDALRHR